MSRTHLLVATVFLSLVISACGVDDSYTASGPEPAIEDPTPEPPKAPLPVDSFNTQAKIEGWQGTVRHMISETAELDNPEDIVQLVAAFDVNQDTLKSMAGDTRYWMGPVEREPTEYDEVDDPHTANLTLADAERLEDADSEFEAGKIYASLGELFAVERCARALRDEGEWKAVGLLGIYLDDFTLLDQATDKLMDADQVSRTQDLVSAAIQAGETRAAKHVADRHGFDVVDGNSAYMIVQRALDGDYELLPNLIEWWMTTDDPEQVVELIVILAEHDKAAARGFARHYLERDQAETFGSVSCGEGCYAYGVTGTIGFYNLIRGDAELRELYLLRTRESAERFLYSEVYSEIDIRTTGDIEGYDFNEHMYYNTGGMQSFAGGYIQLPNILWSALYAVRLNGDRELITCWSSIFDDFGKYSAFGSQFGRAMLGQPFDHQVDGLSSAEEFILTSLAGAEMNEFDAADHNWREAWFDQVIYGADISSVDAVRLWDVVITVEMAVDDGVRYDPDEFEGKASVAARMFEDSDLRTQAAATYLILVRSGWRGELPNEYTWASGPWRYHSHGYGPDDWALIYEAARAGDVERAKRIIVTAWQDKLRLSDRELSQANGKLERVLAEPFNAASFNARRLQDAHDGGFFAVDEAAFTPRTTEAANAIFAPLANELRVGAPDVYRDFILDQVESGNTGLYEAEVTKLVDADEAELFDQLISAREARASN